MLNSSVSAYSETTLSKKSSAKEVYSLEHINSSTRGLSCSVAWVSTAGYLARKSRQGESLPSPWDQEMPRKSVSKPSIQLARFKDIFAGYLEQSRSWSMRCLYCNTVGRIDVRRDTIAILAPKQAQPKHLVSPIRISK